MIRKVRTSHSKGKDFNRDINGTPINRSKVWGERNNKDTKKDRRDWRKKKKRTY